MHILLISIGSGGDTLPFIYWGRVLRSRGHDVTVLANGAYRQVAEELGVPFVDLITPDEHRRRCAERDKSPKNWMKSGLENMLADIRPVYEQISQRARPGETVIAAHVLCMGARLAQEKLGLPVATVLTTPRLLMSFDDPLVSASRLPGFLRSGLGWGIRRLADRSLREPVNAIRGELGLAPLTEPVLKWWHSPTRVIGLFPEWFASPQNDRPPNVTPAGFALNDQEQEPPLSPAVEEFLSSGPPPIVFSYSSTLYTAIPFYRTAIEIAKRLDHRAILLSVPAELTRDLPPTILAVPAMSHLRLFPRARLAVHHAGLGSTAAALWSGIPRFHVPYSMDQPDNAERCERLGVSRWVKLPKFQADRVTPIIRRLLDDPVVSNRCRELAGRHDGYAGLSRASDAIETLSLRK